MDYVYSFNVVLKAFDNFLEANGVDKNAPFDPDVLLVDTITGYREQLLRIKVKPIYLTLDDWMVEQIHTYLEEI